MSRLRIWSIFLLLSSWLTLSPRAAAAPAWHPVDTSELERVRAETPQAAELFDQAEASLRAGDLQAAERSLAASRMIQRNSYLLARRHCQVLTELGRQEDALLECSASNSMGLAMDSRAFVGALMASQASPRPRDLVVAVRQALSARRLQNQPFGEAALCDIAYHIGDEALLGTCIKELQAMAPDNFETKRWQGVQRQTPAWALWLGWLALGAIVLATVFHACWRWLRRPARRAATSVAAAAVFLAVSVFGGVARADEPATEPPAEHETHWQLSKFPIKWEDPESQIPTIEERNRAPLQFGYFLQDLNVEALKAERLGNWAAAVKYWRASAKAVPDAAVGFSRACRAYQVLGETDQALQYCSKAIGLEGATVEDYLRYAELITGRAADLSPGDIEDLDAMVKHLQETNATVPAAVVECRTGVKLEDSARLGRCTPVLGKASPQDPRTMTIQWSYAMLRKDYGEARRLVAAMEKTNMNRQALAQARDATAKASVWWRRPLTDWRYAAALGALLAGVVAGGLRLARRRLSRLEPSAGPGAAPAT